MRRQPGRRKQLPVPVAGNDAPAIARQFVGEVLRVAGAEELGARVVTQAPGRKRDRRHMRLQMARRHADHQPADAALAHRRELAGHDLDMPGHRQAGARVELVEWRSASMWIADALGGLRTFGKWLISEVLAPVDRSELSFPREGPHASPLYSAAPGDVERDLKPGSSLNWIATTLPSGCPGCNRRGRDGGSAGVTRRPPFGVPYCGDYRYRHRISQAIITSQFLLEPAVFVVELVEKLGNIMGEVERRGLDV